MSECAIWLYTYVCDFQEKSGKKRGKQGCKCYDPPDPLPTYERKGGITDEEKQAHKHAVKSPALIRYRQLMTNMLGKIIKNARLT